MIPLNAPLIKMFSRRLVTLKCFNAIVCITKKAIESINKIEFILIHYVFLPQIAIGTQHPSIILCLKHQALAYPHR